MRIKHVINIIKPFTIQSGPRKHGITNKAVRIYFVLLNPSGKLVKTPSVKGSELKSCSDAKVPRLEEAGIIKIP